MSGIWADLQYIVRSLSCRASYCLAVILMLGLGIGAATTVFSFADAVVLNPLPYYHPARLVFLWASKTTEMRPGISWPNLSDVRRENHAFDEVAAYVNADRLLTFGQENSQTVTALYVGRRFFTVLGVHPYCGQVFQAVKGNYGAHRVAVISYAFWNGRFRANRGVIGRNIMLNGEPYTIMGVMPAKFFFPDRAVQVWLPLLPSKYMADRAEPLVHGIARLRTGVDLARAQSAVDTLDSRLAAAYPVTDKNLSIGVFPLVGQITGKYRPAFWALMGGVSFLLLIACANVMHLMLARGIQRGPEISIRFVLGATRMAVLRQLIVEGVSLGILGGGVGVLVSYWFIHVIKGLVLTDILRFNNGGINVECLVFALALSVLTGLLVAIVPALRVSRSNIAETFTQHGISYFFGRRGRIPDLLVVSEVGLAFVLVVSAGLLFRSFLHLTHINWGFKADHVLVIDAKGIAPSWAENVRQNNALMEQSVPQLAGLPGVKSVGVGRCSPITAVCGGPTTVKADGNRKANPFEWFVGPGYFRTLGISILRGRGFTENDNANATRVAIVSRNLAEKLWRGKNPIGEHVFILRLTLEALKEHHILWHEGKRSKAKALEENPESYHWTAYQIVGEVPTVLTRGPLESDKLTIYEDYRQRPGWVPMILDSFFLRTYGPPSNLADVARDIMQSTGQNKLILHINTLEGRVQDSVGASGSSRLLQIIFAFFGSLALALAALGIFSMRTFTISLRTHEIALRVALGASRGEIFRMVLYRGICLTAYGLVSGLLVALATTRILTKYLFAVTPVDPGTFVLSGTIFLLASILACYWPARRAANVDPMVALRHE